MPEFLIGLSLLELLLIPLVPAMTIWGVFKGAIAYRRRQRIKRRMAEIAAMQPQTGHGWNDIQRYRKD